MDYALKVSPMKLMHAHVLKLGDEAGIHFYPRTIDPSNDTVLYSKNEPRVRNALDPLITLPDLSATIPYLRVPRSGMWSAPTAAEKLQAKINEIALTAQGQTHDDYSEANLEDLVTQATAVSDEAETNFQRGSAISEAQLISTGSSDVAYFLGAQHDVLGGSTYFRKAALGFIHSAILLSHFNDIFGGNLRIRTGAAIELRNAAHSYVNSGDYVEAALIGELALHHMFDALIRKGSEGGLTRRDHITADEDITAGDFIGNEYDMVATSWVRVVLSSPYNAGDQTPLEELSPGKREMYDAFLRKILSRGIIAASRGRSQYQHNRIFALNFKSGSAFRAAGDDTAAAHDWLRAVESVTRPGHTLDDYTWMQVDGTIQNVLNIFKYQEPSAPAAIISGAENLFRIARLVRQGVPLGGGEWRVRDITAADRKFLQRAVASVELE